MLIGRSINYIGLFSFCKLCCSYNNVLVMMEACVLY